jgi:hypothetical protein
MAGIMAIGSGVSVAFSISYAAESVFVADDAIPSG